MNKFESWVLKGILRKIVLQGGHTERITEFYEGEGLELKESE